MEIFRALGALVETPGAEHPRLAELLELGAPPPADEQWRLFGLELHPYASVYLGSEGQLGGEARDRIAGFWRALGLDPPAESDHLVVLLATYAGLCERQEGSAAELRGPAGHARRVFLWEHLMSWLPPWLAKLDEIAGPFYRSWGRLLATTLRRECEAAGEPESIPLHLRAAPPLSDPRAAGGDPFLRSLLAPVRSGMILARHDLARAAGELGLGLRAGERHYALRAMLSQDAPATLAWLATEASEWSERHRGLWEPQGATLAEQWASRAEAAQRLLAELGADTSGAGH